MDRSKSGFSLIDILISVGIIAVTVGLSLPYFNTFGEGRKLNAETSALVSVLTLAQKKAVSADLSASCGGGFLGYRVNVTSTTYNLQIRCTGGVNSIQTYSFVSPIQSDTTATIDFKALAAGATASCIRLRNTIAVQCRCIDIKSSGVISNEVCTSCAACP